MIILKIGIRYIYRFKNITLFNDCKFYQFYIQGKLKSKIEIK